MKKALLSAILMLGAFSATAEITDKLMDVQRCVWACQRNTDSDAAYGQCVARNCDPLVSDKAPKSDGWHEGTVDRGRTSYAGVDSANGQRGLYFFCDGAGRSEVMLAGFPGPDAYWVLSIGIDDLTFPFKRRSKGLFAAAKPDHGLFRYLRTGAKIRISRTDGTGGQTELTLRGSTRALNRAMRRC